MFYIMKENTYEEIMKLNPSVTNGAQILCENILNDASAKMSGNAVKPFEDMIIKEAESIRGTHERLLGDEKVNRAQFLSLKKYLSDPDSNYSEGDLLFPEGKNQHEIYKKQTNALGFAQRAASLLSANEKIVDGYRLMLNATPDLCESRLIVTSYGANDANGKNKADISGTGIKNQVLAGVPLSRSIARQKELAGRGIRSEYRLTYIEKAVGKAFDAEKEKASADFHEAKSKINAQVTSETENTAPVGLFVILMLAYLALFTVVAVVTGLFNTKYTALAVILDIILSFFFAIMTCVAILFVKAKKLKEQYDRCLQPIFRKYETKFEILRDEKTRRLHEEVGTMIVDRKYEELLGQWKEYCSTLIAECSGLLEENRTLFGIKTAFLPSSLRHNRELLDQVVIQMNNGTATNYKEALWQATQVIENRERQRREEEMRREEMRERLNLERQRNAEERAHRQAILESQQRTEAYAREQAEAQRQQVRELEKQTELAKKTEESQREQTEYAKQQTKIAEEQRWQYERDRERDRLNKR